MSRDDSNPWSEDQFALLDFGAGRKLESFAGTILDRPCPAAINAFRSASVDWSTASLRVDAQGSWSRSDLSPGDWRVSFGQILFQLKLTPFGHVGLFPEQATNWMWLTAQLEHLHSCLGRPASALNLFAYTGGSTLTMAAAGVRVVHVDASAPSVKWARHNARLSRLDDQPIRWIVEDARKFVARELRRGNRYEVIVLDPPSYGHGPSGKAWNIDRDLPELLGACLQLLAAGPALLLFTAHGGSINEHQIAGWILADAPRWCVGRGRLRLMTLEPTKSLDCGYYVRATQGLVSA